MSLLLESDITFIRMGIVLVNRAGYSIYSLQIGLDTMFISLGSVLDTMAGHYIY